MTNETVTALIPVRAGSNRLKNKNILPFGNSGENLLTYKIDQLKKVKEISQIVVSSDSDEMLGMAIAKGAEIHKRADEYCDEKTRSFGEVVRHIAESIEGNHVLWATCTCPLISPQSYAKAIYSYFYALKSGNDSLVSFESVKRYTWDENGPINYELGLNHVPSQNLPSIYHPTFGITLAPRQKMIDWNYFHGVNPYRYMTSKIESVDIDDELDLAIAKAWFSLYNVNQITPPQKMTELQRLSRFFRKFYEIFMKGLTIMKIFAIISKRASEQASKRASEQASKRASEQASKRASEQA
ncbi:MAG: acylneuraminate cytidylyltransferase family protein, partial [Firmicutes bacterium]|nr:acylneuraminate cytidylyltransferase family protein [Bacillota bacterium]